MDRNLRTGWRDGRYAGDFARNFVFDEIHPTTDEPAGTNCSDHRFSGGNITEFTDGVNAINLRAVTYVIGFQD